MLAISFNELIYVFIKFLTELSLLNSIKNIVLLDEKSIWMSSMIQLLPSDLAPTIYPPVSKF